MAQIPYRANLSAAIFPMTLAKSGRSVINPGPDQNFDKRVDATGNDKESVGIPQVIYAEDVIPTVGGFQTVGYLPDGVVDIPPGEIINAIFCGRVPLTISTEFGINEEDSCDSLDDWVVSPDFSGGGRLSQVRQSPTIGNPEGSFELREDETRDHGQQAYLYKKFEGLSTSNHLKLTSYINFNGADSSQNKMLMLALGSDLAGAGIKAEIHGIDNTIILSETSGWSSFTRFGDVVTAPLPALDFDTWYKTVIDIRVNADATKTCVFEVYDSLGITVIATAQFDGDFNIGDYVGAIYSEVSHDSPAAYASVNWDTLLVQATGVGLDNFVETITIAFLSDNTITWSRSNVSFENLAAISALPRLDFSKPENSMYIPALFL